MTWVAGVDGCRSGWAVVLRAVGSEASRAYCVPNLVSVLDLPEAPAVIGVDMVIGLPDQPEPGGRACDREARKLLGRPRAASVFSPPPRFLLRYSRYDEARAACTSSAPESPGLTAQAFNLFGKIREVDQLLTPALQERVREVHPELSFFEANGGVPMRYSKRTAEGLAERRRVLEHAGFKNVAEVAAALRWSGAGEADVLDACIVCWTAARIHSGEAICSPSVPPCDERGLRMEIWR